MSHTNSTGDNAHGHAAQIDMDIYDVYEELDSDSEDGGMQLDLPDPIMQLQLASREMDTEMAQDIDRPLRRQGKWTD